MYLNSPIDNVLGAKKRRMGKERSGRADSESERVVWREEERRCLRKREREIRRVRAGKGQGLTMIIKKVDS